MRSRTVTSGMAAAAAVVLLGLSAPAFAADEHVSTGGTLETVEDTTGEDGGETDALGETLDGVDDAVSTTEDQVDGTADEGPEPVSEPVDTTTDTTTDTTQQTTDTLREAVGDSSEPTDPAGPTDTSQTDHRGAGGDPVSSPDDTTAAADGRAVEGGGVPAPAPARFALDGFRRTGATSPSFAVSDDVLFEPAPDLAPPTTREVIEPSVSAVPPLSLRAVAVEILVATALLVMATGGLVAELGPERT